MNIRTTLRAGLAVCSLGWALHAQSPSVPDGYVARAPVTARGLAPKLRVKELSPPARNFHLVFGKGDEAVSGLTEFAEKNHLKETRLTAIGAFDSAVLGWFDPEKRAYKKIVINQEVEVVSLIGGITIQNGKPSMHAHAVVAFPDGSTKGGHLIEGHVSLELEVFLSDSDEIPSTAVAKALQ